ncbi:putative ABC transport system ATP-binding protein [Rhizobium leguminosarum]|uniref:ABC transport system ATP-binding protein n=1 Tax=Rhizobium leguminosarum TaxID=384 RepID=A0AAE2SXG2_RHILE|nr:MULTISPECIES: ABC transporter ATP-binding protein [Rhizobium]MBB4291806.1 putative ABC transport system ATP-binding protein [Rhizobium leguminosarum]MBB4298407.1 putative ABC transport system ATP-binding protein [Rhizobium leguminosarum]MBB4309545.1 putative ABC transport system ATP-binding protein [Rhizobium leguminosarum]MBB4418982.1 putative ABC transport system ATP-binding protein [Rhizobium leguminosarum]MBB4433687.1 putative ABC transport system ATP-binding protein [Rhizobium esperanz
MISVKDIKVVFGRGTPLQKQALNGVSLTIEQGSFVTVIGSNGAGKSTLLGVLAGDVIPSEGQVLIGKHEVTRKSTAARAGLVARVFQDPLTGSCGALSIEENLALAARRGEKRGLVSALGSKRRDYFKERIAELNLGLENRLKDRMDLLSGGQRQAVSLVMATLAGSEVLLLDEHTAALDPGMAEFVMNLTQKTVAERKLTTMMVTHSMRQALDYGHRTIMLHGGEIVLDVAGDNRKNLQVEDLIAMFRKMRGQTLDDDALLIG